MGNTPGGTLTVTDGTDTANIALQGNYLSSTWTLSSDGNGGTIVVDPVASSNWQTLKIGAGGFVRNLSPSPAGTIGGAAHTNGPYRLNGTPGEQPATPTSMPAQHSSANRN